MFLDPEGARDPFQGRGSVLGQSTMSSELSGMRFVMLKKLGLVASTTRCSSSMASGEPSPEMRTVWRRLS